MKNFFRRTYLTAAETEQKITEFESKHPMFTNMRGGDEPKKVLEYGQWVDGGTGLPWIAAFQFAGAGNHVREKVIKDQGSDLKFLSRRIENVDDPISDLLGYDRSIEDLIEDKPAFKIYTMAELARAWLYKEFWSPLGGSILDQRIAVREIVHRYRFLRDELVGGFGGYGGKTSQTVEALFFDRGALGYFVLGIVLLEQKILPRHTQLGNPQVVAGAIGSYRPFVKRFFPGSDRSCRASSQVSTVIRRHWTDCRTHRFTLALDFPYFMLVALADQRWYPASLRQIFKDLEAEGAYLAASEAPYRQSTAGAGRCRYGCFRSRYESMARETFGDMKNDLCLVCLSMNFSSEWQRVPTPYLWGPRKPMTVSTDEIALQRSRNRLVNESQGKVSSLMDGYDVLEEHT